MCIHTNVYECLFIYIYILFAKFVKIPHFSIGIYEYVCIYVDI
jgi:hypothetical protein